MYQYQSIELHFFVYLALNESFNLDFYHIISPWEELSVTWNIKPVLGEFIKSQTVSHQGEYSINIKSYLSWDILSISILLNSVTVNVCRIPSLESDLVEEGQITYIELSEIDLTIGFISVLFLIGFLGLRTAI